MLGLATHTARRHGPYQNTDGVVTKGAPTEFDIRASIQPLSAYQRQSMPGGLSASAQYLLLTTDELQAVDPEADEPADQVHYRGRWLEVHSHEDFSDAPFLAHREYVLAMPDTEDDP